MKKILALASSVVMMGVTSFALAGGPDMMPAPNDEGFYVGLGGSWNSTDIEHRSILLNGAVQQDINNHTTRLAPEAQVGYWGALNAGWMWGLKAFYKYLYARDHVAITTMGASIDDQVDHEAALLALLGQHMGPVFAYVGLGVALLTLRTALTTNAPLSVNISKTLWGGIGEIGATYNFDPMWFLDVNYSLAATGNESAVFNATHSYKNYVMNQQVGITINRRFNF